MSVSRGIAQARSYSQAFTFLSVQVLVLAVATSVYAPHWAIGVVVPIVFILLSMNKWTRMALLFSLSTVWSAVVFQLASEGNAGVWMYFATSFVFVVLYAINRVGVTGMLHSIPDFSL